MITPQLIVPQYEGFRPNSLRFKKREFEMNNRQRGVSQDELSSIYQMHDRIQAIAEPDRAVEVAASSLALNLLPNGCIRDSSGPTQTTRLSRTGCLRFLTSSVTFRRSLIRSTLVAFN